MLVYIDESIVPLLNAGGQGAVPVLRFLDYAAMAHREGKHIVTAEPSTFAGLSAGTQIPQSIRGSLRSAAARAAEANGLKRVLPFYATVGHGAEFLNAFAPQSVQRILRLDVDWFDDSLTIQAPVLLAENGRDADLYIEMARILARKNRWNIRILLDPSGAGGSNLAREFATALRRKRACLCIADSDQCCSACQLGATARNVAKVNATATWGVHHALVTKGRELENLLPQELLAAAFEGDSDRVERLGRLRAMDPGAALFVDLKAGLRAGAIEAMVTGTPDRSFWASVDAVARKQLQPYGSCDSTACERPVCKCILIPGLGEHTLDRVLDVLRKAARQFLDALSFEAGNLEELCLNVIAFGCANPPLRA
jgi:hypothetical protein